MTATAIRMDSARLARAIDLHRYKVPHREGYDMEGLVMSCTRYCAADIAKRFEDPNLMELTDAEEAAEEATWD